MMVCLLDELGSALCNREAGRKDVIYRALSSNELSEDVTGTLLNLLETTICVIWRQADLSVHLLQEEDKKLLNDTVLWIGKKNWRVWTTGRPWLCGMAPSLRGETAQKMSPSFGHVITVSVVVATVQLETDERTASTVLHLLFGSLQEPSIDGTLVTVSDVASALSADDDRLLIGMDALLRLNELIPMDSPLNGHRVILSILLQHGFSDSVFVEMLFDDDGHIAFNVLMRLYTCMRESMDEWKRVASEWSIPTRLPGRWMESRDEEDNDDEMEDEECLPSTSSNLDWQQLRVDEDENEEDESHQSLHPNAPFLIKVRQQAGQLHEEKTFLLPATEEKKHYQPPYVTYAENVWESVMDMSERLQCTLERHVKLRRLGMRRECRQLSTEIGLFLKKEKEG